VFGITVSVDIYFGKKSFNRYSRTIIMPFIPYPQTMLALDGFNLAIEVETLMWRETNTEEKIAAFGKVIYNKYATNRSEWLHKSLTEKGWKKW